MRVRRVTAFPAHFIGPNVKSVPHSGRGLAGIDTLGHFALGYLRLIRGRIQKFPDCPPGPGILNGTALCH
jgi:hypothetical protein